MVEKTWNTIGPIAERVARGVDRLRKRKAVDMAEHSHHPGFEAAGCPLRLTVSGNRTDGGRGGYACRYTGEHCLPSDRCAQRRADQATLDETRIQF